MAEILKEELKEKLVVEPLPESPTSKANRLPSPKQLFGKIIIKVIEYKTLQKTKLVKAILKDCQGDKGAHALALS